MAVPNSSYANSLLATTFEAYSGTLYDNVFTNTPTWEWFKRHQDPFDGGVSILEHLLYSQGSNAKSFTKGDSFAVTEPDPVTAAAYDLVQYGVSIPIYRIDLMKNRGRARMIDLAKAKMTQAELDLKDLYSDDLWASSHASGKILPLPVAVSADSSVGNIDSTTYTWWDANVDSDAVAVSVADMVTSYNNCNKGPGGAFPTFAPCGQLFYEGYEALGGDLLRLTDGDRARLNLGFEAMWFKGALMAFDPYMTTGECYMLNEKFIKWRPHTENAKSWIHQQENKDDVAGLTLHIIWGMGAITVGRRASLAKLTAKTAP